ncbi:MAG: hypothetical protein QM767_28835 [Anaeromyxobacter sp.]
MLPPPPAGTDALDAGSLTVARQLIARRQLHRALILAALLTAASAYNAWALWELESGQAQLGYVFFGWLYRAAGFWPAALALPVATVALLAFEALRTRRMLARATEEEELLEELAPQRARRLRRLTRRHRGGL